MKNNENDAEFKQPTVKRIDNEAEFKQRLINIVGKSISAFETMEGPDFFENGRIMGIEKLVKIQAYIDLWSSPVSEATLKATEDLEKLFDHD